MSDPLPFVTVVIPCRNEERYLDACLESVVAGSYPPDRMEILVVDGASEDRTPEIIRAWARRSPSVRLVPNDGRTVPHALNQAIRLARGEIIVRMDAHATYEPDYVLKCVRHLQRSGADNVGGRLIILPGGEHLMARAIAQVLAHPFGIGSAQFRFASGEPRWADTVPFGCYPRSVFERVGFFDEQLTRGQDMAFNLRLRNAGGRILLVPEIVSRYYARGDLRSFVRHNYVNGYWAVYPLLFGRRAFTTRHLIPLAFVAALTLGGGLAPFWAPAKWLLLAAIVPYAVVMLGSAAWVAWRERDPRLLFALPLAFAGLHVPYGLGSTVGLVDVVRYVLRGRVPQNESVYR